MAFRDVLDITVQGGKGGDGGMSFLRLKYIPKGGPDGGNGGHGGSVYIEAIDDVSSLDRLVSRQVYKAGTGQQGEGRNRAGPQGDDLTIRVPVGTIATDVETGEVIADLIEVGQRAIVAQGGLGGRGNAAFANSQRRTPRFSEYGTHGEKRRLRLELRTIADVGLVGYPNAGKSSLLAALSNAKPQIASYPFTTLSPNLGVVERDMKRFTMADIPGIIEDAHKGKGLGLEFLRHISRTRLLVYVLDIADDPAQTLKSLQHELQAYDPLLLERMALIVLNKTDLAAEDEVTEEVDSLTGFGLPIVPVSALEAQGLELLKETLFALIPEKPVLDTAAEDVRQVRVAGMQVKRDMSGEGWVVAGPDVEAVVSRFDSTNRDAVAYLQNHFMALGVFKMLKKAGAKDGEDVIIGDAVFEYFDEDKVVQAASEDDTADEADDDYTFENDDSDGDTDA